jgi:hypothetical protein
MVVSLPWPFPFRRHREPPRSAELMAAIAAVTASGLFDVSYYLLNGGDVAAAKVDPVDHFCTYGWREGRRPNHFFDPHWYGRRHLGGIEAINPLIHFIEEGERAGCWPINFFDPAWYRIFYGLTPDESALQHYLMNRRTQTVAPNRWFDLSFYLDRHRQEMGANRDPFMHLVRNGAALRDYDPSPTFDSARYRREVMVLDTTIRTGLISHEMRVPLIHYLDGLILSKPT